VGDSAVDFDLSVEREIEDSCLLNKLNFPIVCMDFGRLLTSVLTGWFRSPTSQRSRGSV